MDFIDDMREDKAKQSILLLYLVSFSVSIYHFLSPKNSDQLLLVKERELLSVASGNLGFLYVPQL